MSDRILLNVLDFSDSVPTDPETTGATRKTVLRSFNDIGATATNTTLCFTRFSTVPFLPMDNRFRVNRILNSGGGLDHFEFKTYSSTAAAEAVTSMVPPSGGNTSLPYDSAGGFYLRSTEQGSWYYGSLPKIEASASAGVLLYFDGDPNVLPTNFVLDQNLVVGLTRDGYTYNPSGPRRRS
jgi:hypothetical protein